MAKNKEWEKEMMKWSKQNLINLLEKVISERKQQQTSVSGLNIPVVMESQFEAYAAFCIECDRQGMKPIKYKGYLEIG